MTRSSTSSTPTGAALVYSTYLGGARLRRRAAASRWTPPGSAYVTGRHVSADFPTTAGAFDTTFNGGTATPSSPSSTPTGVGPRLLHLPGRQRLGRRRRHRRRRRRQRLRDRVHQLARTSPPPPAPSTPPPTAGSRRLRDQARVRRPRRAGHAHARAHGRHQRRRHPALRDGDGQGRVGEPDAGHHRALSRSPGRSTRAARTPPTRTAKRPSATRAPNSPARTRSAPSPTPTTTTPRIRASPPTRPPRPGRFRPPRRSARSRSDGGTITANNGDKATFGGNAQSNAAGNVKGQQQYQDHGPAQPQKVKSIKSWR